MGGGSSSLASSMSSPASETSFRFPNPKPRLNRQDCQQRQKHLFVITPIFVSKKTGHKMGCKHLCLEGEPLAVFSNTRLTIENPRKKRHRSNRGPKTWGWIKQKWANLLFPLHNTWRWQGWPVARVELQTPHQLLLFRNLLAEAGLLPRLSPWDCQLGGQRHSYQEDYLFKELGLENKFLGDVRPWDFCR